MANAIVHFQGGGLFGFCIGPMSYLKGTTDVLLPLRDFSKVNNTSNWHSLL